MKRKLLLFVRFLFSKILNLTSKKIFNPSLGFLTLMMFFVYSFANAATFTSRAVGDWNSATTWTRTSGTDADGIPDADDVVIIATGFNVTLTRTEECASLTLNNSTLFINTFTLNNFGNITILNGTNSRITITTGTLNVGGNFASGGTLNSGTGLVNYNGASQNVGAYTYYNLIISGTSNKTAAGNLTVNGDFTLSGGTFVANNATSFTHSIVGNYNQTGGVFDFNGGNSGVSTVNLGGNFTNSAGAGSITTIGVVQNGILNFNGTGIQTLTMPTAGAGAWVKYYVNATSTLKLASNFTLSTANTSDTDPWMGELNVTGTIDFGTYNVSISGGRGTSGTAKFILNSGGTLITANAAGIDGSIPVAATMLTTYNSGANYIFNGSVAQVTSSGMPATVNSLTIRNTSAAGVTMTKATTVTNLWSFATGSKVALGAFQHSAGVLTLGGAGPLLSTWGATISNPVAQNTNDTFFSNSGGNTGRISVSGAPYPAIDNNFASYGTTGEVTGIKGENDGALTLSAPIGSIFINVKFASYGLPNGTAPNFTIGSCHAFNSRTVTTGLLGNTSATIPASGSYNNTFGDPCYGIVKKYYVVATYSTPICAGTNPGTITGSTPTGGNGTYSYLWEVSTTNPSSGYSAAPGVNTGKDYTITGNVSQKTYYRRTVTSGIYSDETIVIVVTNTLAEIGAPTSASASPNPVCAGGTVTLTVNGGTMGTNTGGYAEWTSGSCNGTLVGRSTLSNGSITVTPTANTTYYVKYKNACGETACGTPITVTNSTSITLTPATINFTTCRPTAVANLPIGYSATTGTPINYSITWNAAAITAGFANKTNVAPSPGFTASGGAGSISNAINVPANVAAGTYTGTFTVSTASCTSFGTNITVTVNPRPTSVVSGSTTICNGANATVSVSFTGTAPWNISYTYGAISGTFSTSLNPYTATVNPNTTTTYAITGLSDANCTAVAADMTGSAVITVKQIQSTPTIASYTDIDCANAGTITLGNLPAGAWQINQTGQATATINGSGTSYQITGLAVGNYTFTVETATTCTSTSVSRSIADSSTSTWDGTTWVGGAPTSSKRIVIASSSGTPFPSSSPVVNGCSLTINPTINVTVQSGVTLVITNAVTTNGQLTFKTNSSLVQTTNATNTGSITYERETNVRRYDLTYWSTPVTNPSFKLYDLSPATLGDKYFIYDPNSGWIINYNGTQVMEAGKGYNVRAPQPFDTGIAATFTGKFTGIPNNGDINPTVVSGTYNLVGNPYPSAISAVALINGNTNLGTIYLWTHNTPPQAVPGDHRYFYTSDDYAAFNLTGSAQGSAQGALLNGQPFQEYIAAGQGFLAQPKTATMSFNNTMRRNGNNQQFYKTTESVGFERNRVWLNLSNDQGAFKQALIGYIEGATNGLDINYDAGSLEANPYVDFYSVNEANKLTIQGRALPFDNKDVVPLGYNTTVAGEFTIAIDRADGFFDTQEVYLEDLTAGKTVNLRDGNYKFTTAVGTFENRFNLRYTSKTLGTGEFEDLDNSVLVSVKNKVVKISSSKETLKEVNIYNAGAQLLYSKNKVNSNDLQISNLNSSDQVLLVKVTLENGHTLTKKVVFSNL